jgi:hypothetical protein
MPAAFAFVTIYVTDANDCPPDGSDLRAKALV